MMWQTMSLPISRRRTVSENVLSSNGVTAGTSPGIYDFHDNIMARKQRSNSTKNNQSTKHRDFRRGSYTGTLASSTDIVYPESSNGSLAILPPGPTSTRLRAYSQPLPVSTRLIRAQAPPISTYIQEELINDHQVPSNLKHKDFCPRMIKKDEYHSFR